MRLSYRTCFRNYYIYPDCRRLYYIYIISVDDLFAAVYRASSSPAIARPLNNRVFVRRFFFSLRIRRTIPNSPFSRASDRDVPCQPVGACATIENGDSFVQEFRGVSVRVVVVVVVDGKIEAAAKKKIGLARSPCRFY